MLHEMLLILKVLLDSLLFWIHLDSEKMPIRYLGGIFFTWVNLNAHLYLSIDKEYFSC